MELSHDDVLEILQLIENSKVEYLEIEVDGTKIIANKSGINMERASSTPVMVEPNAMPRQMPVEQSEPARLPESAPAPVATPPKARLSSESEGGLVKVLAPIVGVFYRQSEPGAPPYVEVGSKVDEGATLGLLEVMKMFSSVTAQVKGEIVEILVDNNDFVEFEQPLMLIRLES